MCPMCMQLIMCFRFNEDGFLFERRFFIWVNLLFSLFENNSQPTPNPLCKDGFEVMQRNSGKSVLKQKHLNW